MPGTGLSAGGLCKSIFQDRHRPSADHDLAQFQTKAAQFKNIITVPEYETSPAAVKRSLETTIADANAALDRIGKLRPAEVTFANTVGALDDLMLPPATMADRLNLVKETSRDAAVRDAATDALKKFSEWSVGLEYREDVYAAIKAFADAKPKLAADEAKLLQDTLRDYRRAGLSLPKGERDEVERLRKELTGLTTDFESNINKARGSLKFTKAELAGVPENFLTQEGIKTGDDEYTVMANITFHYLMVLENAKNEDTRKKFQTVHDSLAKESNAPLLKQILELRSKIAGKLGYAWADAISADMASVFERSPGGYFDVNTGLKLRNEIYAVGDSRDPTVSIGKFLGRQQSNQPFLKKIGIATK